MTPAFHDQDALVDRLAAMARQSQKAVTFLVGSPLTAPTRVGEPGVPNVEGVVELIAASLDDADTRAAFDSAMPPARSGRYQAALNFLIGRRGQEAANAVITNAVLKARRPGGDNPSSAPINSEALMKDTDGWFLPSAVDRFVRLLAATPEEFGRVVLTTNFDPLIEVGLQKHAQRFYRTVLHQDGNLNQTIADGRHIVHLHGYWSGYDTLHTPQQIARPRPQLKNSIGRLIEASTLVVLGYGGWDDILTRTLAEVLSDGGRNPDVVWAFHESDPAIIEASSVNLLAWLDPALGRGRAALYKGIDAETTLSAILAKLHRPTVAPSAAIRGEAKSKPTSRTAVSFAESDSPPSTDHWIGRQRELELLRQTRTPVVFITGLGGQGKSLLAAEYVGRLQGESIWDWRDCREESDRLVTQLLRVLERLSDGQQRADDVDANDLRALAALIFRAAGDRQFTLVFDNVDQYIDLASLRPTKGLDILINEARIRSHCCRLIFTCRPEVQLPDDRVLLLPLRGLSESDTKALLAGRSGREVSLDIATDIYKITDGHPLWTNMLAMQGTRHPDGFAGILKDIGAGDPTLPQTARSIWQALNNQQRDILRTMAELDRPESETSLLDFLPGHNANRVGKALRALKSFYMVETRRLPGHEALLDLHPIIRHFVRTEFPKKERQRFADVIVRFLDRMIDRFKGTLDAKPSFQMLEHWTRKADYLIEFGDLRRALAVIDEIGDVLVRKGYSEELVRVTSRLLANIDWAESVPSGKTFDNVFYRGARTATELGRTADVDAWLSRYEAALPGKSAQYINLCDLRCYAAWYRGDFSAAIQWGEDGERLKRETAVDTAFSCEHNLALARRDGGRVEEALASFLGKHSPDELLRADTDKDASVFGNIGRCLFLLGRPTEALNFYRRSAQLLETDDWSGTLMNKGYARYWIGLAAATLGDVELAAVCYRAAWWIWESLSPPRAALPIDALTELVTDNSALAPIMHMGGGEVERRFAKWLHAESL